MSFGRKLCPKFMRGSEPATRSELYGAMRFSIALQLILILLAGMILDGGATAQLCLYGSISYWLAAAVILLQRRQATQNEVGFLRSGYFLMCILTGLANALRP